MTPFLPGYEPGTWVEIVSGPEMLCSLQYDYGTTFTLTDSLPYDPILGKQGKIVAILRMFAAILFLLISSAAQTISFKERNFLFAVVRLSLLAFPKPVQRTYTNSPLSSLKTKAFFPGTTGSSPPLNFTLISFLRSRFLPCPSMIC